MDLSYWKARLSASHDSFTWMGMLWPYQGAQWHRGGCEVQGGRFSSLVFELKFGKPSDDRAHWPWLILSFVPFRHATVTLF